MSLLYRPAASNQAANGFPARDDAVSEVLGDLLGQAVAVTWNRTLPAVAVLTRSSPSAGR